MTRDGIKTNPLKVKAMQEFKVPRNVNELKGFLGLTGYYRKFIKVYSMIAKPLTCLLQKGVTYVWGEQCDKAFNILKNKLISDPILQYPDFDKEFIVTTDASNHSLGAVLSQIVNDTDKPIAYASQTLNDAESRYITVERELLAIVWACEYWRHFLYGKHSRIITDHKPLVWLMLRTPRHDL